MERAIHKIFKLPIMGNKNTFPRSYLACSHIVCAALSINIVTWSWIISNQWIQKSLSGCARRIRYLFGKDLEKLQTLSRSSQCHWTQLTFLPPSNTPTNVAQPGTENVASPPKRYGCNDCLHEGVVPAKFQLPTRSRSGIIRDLRTWPSHYIDELYTAL